MIGKRFYILLLVIVIVGIIDQRLDPLLLILLPMYGIYQLHKLHTDYFKVEAVCITYCKHRYMSTRNAPGHTEYNGLYKYAIDDKEYITTESETHRSFKPKVNEKCIIYVNKNDYECILPQSVVKYWCIMPFVFIFAPIIFALVFVFI